MKNQVVYWAAQGRLRQVVQVMGAIDLISPACVQPFHGWQHGSPGSTLHRQDQCLEATGGVAETPTPSLNSIPRRSLQVQSEQMLLGCDLNSLTEVNPKTHTLVVPVDEGFTTHIDNLAGHSAIF